MSLTKQDLADIREVVVDALNQSFKNLYAPRFDALEKRMDRIIAGSGTKDRVSHTDLEPNTRPN